MPDRPIPKDIQSEIYLKQLEEYMHFEHVYEKLRKQMQPGLDAILNQIDDEEERMEWNKKVYSELSYYIKDVIDAKKKGKTPSDKKLMNIIKDVQKVQSIIEKTKNKEEI
jgi:hypothetical protein